MPELLLTNCPIPRMPEFEQIRIERRIAGSRKGWFIMPVPKIDKEATTGQTVTQIQKFYKNRIILLGDVALFAYII